MENDEIDSFDSVTGGDKAPCRHFGTCDACEPVTVKAFHCAKGCSGGHCHSTSHHQPVDDCPDKYCVSHKEKPQASWEEELRAIVFATSGHEPRRYEHLIEFIRSLLASKEKEARVTVLEEAMSAVPKKWGKVDGPFEGERASGWNACRSATLKALAKLEPAFNQKEEDASFTKDEKRDTIEI